MYHYRAYTLKCLDLLLVNSINCRDFSPLPRLFAETYVQKEQVYTDPEPEIVAQCKRPGRCKSCRRIN